MRSFVGGYNDGPDNSSDLKPLTSCPMSMKSGTLSHSLFYLCCSVGNEFVQENNCFSLLSFHFP